MSVPLPDCLNCGATLAEEDISSRRKFARCSFCLTLLNVRGYFDSDGREHVTFVEPEDLAAARNALGRAWLPPVMLAGKMMIGACALMYFPFVLITMFGLTHGHDPMPRIIGFLVAATVLPMLVIGIGAALVYPFIERNPLLSRKAARRARVRAAEQREQRALAARRKLVAEVGCPKCGVSLAPEAIDLATRHATCSYCGHNFDATAQLRKPVDEEQARRLEELRELERRLDARLLLWMRLIGVTVSLALLGGAAVIIGPLRAFKDRDAYLQLSCAFLLMGFFSCAMATAQVFMPGARVEKKE